MVARCREKPLSPTRALPVFAPLAIIMAVTYTLVSKTSRLAVSIQCLDIMGDVAKHDK